MPEWTAYALAFSVESHWLRNDADLALASAREIEEIARGLGENPVVAGHLKRSVALAHLADGRPADAIEPARTALEIFEEVERQHAVGAATPLAVALLGSGDLAAAQSAAETAISLGRRSLRGNYEAIAHGVMARALLRREGAAARSAAEAALDEAASLIERTGATTLEPSLCEWRAELAVVLGERELGSELLNEAKRGFEAIGAPLHAERIEREMAE